MFSHMPTTSEVITQCQEEEIELIRLLYVGNDGVPRGRVVDTTQIESVLESGMNLSSAMQSFNSLDHLAPGGQFGAAGEIRLVPDPDTFQILPYAERAAVMLCDMYSLDQTPWEADPRSSLTKYLSTLAERDLTANVAFESEFYLIREAEEGFEPFDNSVCFGADGMQAANDIVLDMIDSLKAQDMSIVTYYPEYGPGQQELVVEHTPGVSAADNHILYKQTIRSVARNHGIDATFVPKPFEDAAGSGCHIHLSMWEDGENVFFDEDSNSPYGLSETARHFIGGILKHTPALVALTAASVSSYRRLRPHMWASAYTCWGQDNREAAVRVPSSEWDNRGQTTRFEFKPADNTANPYLAELGLLAAGMDGIENEIDPGQPVNQDPSSLSDEQRDERGIERLPETLGDALTELESDSVLKDALGETLHQSYLDVKRSQWEEYSGTVTDWELGHLTRAF
jgi:glutamine synthetase